MLSINSSFRGLFHLQFSQKSILVFSLKYPQKRQFQVPSSFISNLIDTITDTIPLDKIISCLKRAFLINDSIYSEELYFKGIFPKIIVSADDTDEKNIKGICSLYYESDANLSNNSNPSTVYALNGFSCP